MHTGGADFTLTFRRLSDAVRGNAIPVQSQFVGLEGINAWLERWRARLAEEAIDPPESRAAAMDRVNPIYIPRNHKVEDALTAAVEDDDLSRASPSPTQNVLWHLTRAFLTSRTHMAEVFLERR